MKKTVLLGVTSGIAAYKSIDLVKKLKKEGLNVFVVMTKSASKMVPPEEFEKASGHKVSIELFEKGFDSKKILETRHVEHIDLADRADIMLIAPATANIIAKLAYGLADDFLTTTALAHVPPLLICPSMNVHMWKNPIMQENIARLKKRGNIIVEPENGSLACGYEGVGRLPEADFIKNAVVDQLNYRNSLSGLKIMVSAGATIEKIDEVRHITNRSSGKMGIALAEECFMRGAQVLLLRSKNSVSTDYPIKEELFSSSSELFELVKKHVVKYDYFYHVAAVSDFTVSNLLKGKISSKKSHTIHLLPAIKILDQIKKINPKIHLIAFKAEYEPNEKKLIEKALQTLRKSKADIVIANDISKGSQGFEVDDNAVYIVMPDGTSKYIPISSKKEIAKSIISFMLPGL